MSKPQGRRRRSVGHSFASDTAVIIMRDTGQVINKATVLDKEFRIKTPDIGTLRIKTKLIKLIVYKNLPSYPTDMLKTMSGSEFNGEVLNDPVRVKSDDLGGEAALPKANILSIIW